MTVREELDKVELKLHDSSHVLWDRAELLRLYNDGYRALLAETNAVRRLTILDVPARVTFARTFEWEDGANWLLDGTEWRYSWQMMDGLAAGSYPWETEQLEGVTPTKTRAAITQPWERVYSGDTDAPFLFALPKDHESVRRVTWDNRVLVPVAIRELDDLEMGWMREPGEPWVWTAGTGRTRTFEIFAISTTYSGYALLSDPAGPYGLPRGFSGGRTYAVDTSPPYGVVRGISSPDRQYIPPLRGTADTRMVGTPREWHTTDDAVMVIEAVTPDFELAEDDVPDLIPMPCAKYLRFYVLSRAFAHTGEGQRLPIAAHYEARFKAGVMLLKKLADTIQLDQNFAREGGIPDRRRPPRVRLPSKYPRISV